MPNADAQICRQPLVLRATTRRSWDQDLSLRFPVVALTALRLVWSVLLVLPPRSALRRLAVRNLARRGVEAVNRRDLELFALSVHPEIESTNTAGVVALGGLPPSSHGREDWLAAQERWLADWEELRYEPQEIFDLGDGRFLLLGRGTGTGRGSGIRIDTEWALLTSVSQGLIIREQNFLDHAEARRAAGLPS